MARYVIELNVPSEHVARAQFDRVCDILTINESARLIDTKAVFSTGDEFPVVGWRVLAAHNMGEDG